MNLKSAVVREAAVACLPDDMVCMCVCVCVLGCVRAGAKVEADCQSVSEAHTHTHTQDDADVELTVKELTRRVPRGCAGSIRKRGWLPLSGSRPYFCVLRASVIEVCVCVCVCVCVSGMHSIHCMCNMPTRTRAH